MRITLLGGDRRMNLLADMLRLDGHTVMHTRRMEGALPELLLLPTPLSRDGRTVFLSDTLLSEVEALPPSLPTVGGGLSPMLLSRPRVLDLLSIEEAVTENARLTAWATLSVLLAEPPRVLSERGVVILGFGRIGRALLSLLLSLGIPSTVHARSETARQEAAAMGAAVREFSAAVEGNALAVNTAPSPVTLPPLAPGSVLFDLAGLSPDDIPTGIDFRPLPGLPGKYYPESAARISYVAVRRFISTL